MKVGDIIEKIINIIIEKNKNLFGDNLSVKKINVGFTNTVYNINDSFIVKICSNINNENEFKKEIDFYKANENNTLIPKLYYSDTQKIDVPYIYEIIEKVEGVTLYYVWHKFSEEQRENVIKQLCDAMKQMHLNIGKNYDWIEYNKNRFNNLFEIAKNNKLLNDDEIKIIYEAYSLFDKYLESDQVVLIHNDLHFDNIFVNDEKIKIIDFERSMYAPKDFELHMLYYMIRQPWKHANEECEEYTKVEDYVNIMSYVEKYYPEIINTPYLYKRLAIYDLIYELSHFVKYLEHYDELKEAVIENAKKIILEDVNNG